MMRVAFCIMSNSNDCHSNPFQWTGSASSLLRVTLDGADASKRGCGADSGLIGVSCSLCGSSTGVANEEDAASSAEGASGSFVCALPRRISCGFAPESARTSDSQSALLLVRRKLILEGTD